MARPRMVQWLKDLCSSRLRAGKVAALAPHITFPTLTGEKGKITELACVVLSFSEPARRELTCHNYIIRPTICII